MAEDHDRRMPLDRAEADDACLERVGRVEDITPNDTTAAPVTSPAVSLMITNRQRVALRAFGFSDEAVQHMTPAEAHEKLRLAKPSKCLSQNSRCAVASEQEADDEREFCEAL